MEAAEKEEISVEDEAVDKTIFKDCGKIAFYRRQKQQLTKNTTYQALLGSVDTEQDSTRFQIISEATKIPLVAEVYGIEKDIFRLKINEETPLKPRYEVPDVINSKLGTVRLVCSGDTGSLILTNRKGDLKCHVSANPFKIDLLSKNEAVISINSLGQLYFEHLQVPHKQRYLYTLLALKTHLNGACLEYQLPWTRVFTLAQQMPYCLSFLPFPPTRL